MNLARARPASPSRSSQVPDHTSVTALAKWLASKNAGGSGNAENSA